MAKLIVPSGWLQRSTSCCRARAGVACFVVAFAASCATGVSIDEDVQIAPLARTAGAEGGPFAEEGTAGGAEPSGDDAENAEGGAGASETSDGSSGEEAAPAEPRDEEPRDEENGSEPVFPDIVPIADVEPESDGDDSDPSASPGTEPAPTTDVSPDDTDVTEPTPPDAVEPPPASDSVLEPTPALDPVEVPVPDTLPAPAHCLADWEGHSCDVCSGQTQSDLLACRVYIDCYIVNDCDPGSCGSVEQVCGVNQLGNGLAPKEVADAVYGCMCAL